MAIREIQITDLTSGTLGGAGVFDALMRASKVHLEDQFNADRIRGPEYATVYLGQLESAMQTAMTFLLQQQKITLEAEILEQQKKLAEIEVLKANIQLAILEEQKLTAVVERQLITAQVDKVRADITLSGAQLAQVQAETLNVPKQGLVLDAQKTQIAQQTANLLAEAANIPKQGLLLDVQKAQVEQETANLVSQELQIVAQTALITQQKTNLTAEALNIPKQGELVDAQKDLAVQNKLNAVTENTVLVAQECKLRAEFDLTQQSTLKGAAEVTLLAQKTATEKAQILDLGVDDNSVIGRQKMLYKAQTDGFKQDARQKLASLYAEIWKTCRMTDNDWQANTTQGLDDATMGSVMASVRNGINAL